MTDLHYDSYYTLSEAERLLMRNEIAKEILRWTQDSRYLSKKEQARARKLAEDIRQGASAEEPLPATRSPVAGPRKGKARPSTKSSKRT